jgi:hypothetical protein
MSSLKEEFPEENVEHDPAARDFSAPNGEYVLALAMGKLMHFPGFEAQEEDEEPTDHLPSAS